MRRMTRVVAIIATRTDSMTMMREIPVCVVEDVTPIELCKGRILYQ